MGTLSRPLGDGDTMVSMASDDLRRRLIIELDGSATEPIGWLVADGAQRARFEGWLQLLTAIEDALGRPEQAPNPWDRRPRG